MSPIITMPDSSEAPLAAAIGLRPQSSSEIIGSGDRRSWITNSATATAATTVMSPISNRPEVESAVRSAMIAAMAIVNTRGAQMIDPAAAAGALLVQVGPESGRGERADRQVHPENPGPGKMLDDEAAGQAGRGPPTAPRRSPASPGSWPARGRNRGRRRWSSPSAGPRRRRRLGRAGTTISDGIDHANPHSIEPKRKIAIPTSITVLRPARSASLPNTTVVAVWVRRNAENTQL